jgi:hypothetical protein
MIFQLIAYNDSKKASDELPPVLSHQLAKFGLCTFTTSFLILRCHAWEKKLNPFRSIKLEKILLNFSELNEKSIP